MNQSVRALEDELCRVYEQQATEYQGVLQISEQVARAFAENADADQDLQKLNALLDQIDRRNAEAKALRGRWESLRLKPGSRLKQLLERLERLIRTAIDGIDRAEESARRARDRLLPELRHEALGRQMHQAYTQYGAQSR